MSTSTAFAFVNASQAITTAAFIAIGIRLIEKMSMNAMRLLALLPSSIASSHVLGMSNCLKVIRPNTRAIAAEMIPFEAIGCFADQKSMGKDHAFINSEMAITVVEPAEPYSATIGAAWINLLPKAFTKGKMGTHRVCLSLGVTGQGVRAPLPYNYTRK